MSVSDTQLSYEHPRWIGAWWLGFIILGGVQLIAAVPLFWFPKQIKSKSIGNETPANGNVLLPLADLASPVKPAELDNKKTSNQQERLCSVNSSKYTSSVP